MPKTTANGITLHYLQAGKGPDLVLLHGLGGNQAIWHLQFVGRIKSALFGGEGLFFTTLTGPGRVWLQSLPFSRLADRIIAAAPRHGGESKGEGSVLGGLGRIIGGDKPF